MMREAARDRISNLPDSLLHHIHSFLETKDGARTSVLSKRWNYIWTTVPTLEFKDSYTSNTENFMDFVDGTLHRRNSSNVHRFSLASSRQLNESRLRSWISALIRGNVKELSLKYSLCIPRSIFTYKSLASLELTVWRVDFTFPKFISFPKLKRLALKGFKFTDEDWNEEIFSNSPVLEELVLEIPEIRMRSFYISIPTLKLLEMEIAIVSGLPDCALKIHAPSLVTFNYYGPAAKEFALSSFPSLVKAVVCFLSYIDGVKIRPILRAVAHVKCLTVSDHTLQALCSACDLSNVLPTFHNLKVLRISDNLSTDQGLIALLRAAPKLELLLFEELFFDELKDSDEDDNDDAEGNGDDVNDVESVEGENNHDNENEIVVSDGPKCDWNDEGESNCDNEYGSWVLDPVTNGCLFTNLKSVCFQEFVGNPRELRWVKLILRNAKALRIMTIRYEDCGVRFANEKSEKELMVVIPKLPRVSTGCVIKFYSWGSESAIEIS